MQSPLAMTRTLVTVMENHEGVFIVGVERGEMTRSDICFEKTTTTKQPMLTMWRQIEGNGGEEAQQLGGYSSGPGQKERHCQWLASIGKNVSNA